MEEKKKFLKNIEDPHVRGVVSMFYTSFRYDKLLETELKPFGISHEQFSILKILIEHHPDFMSLKEIQSLLMNNTANATRLVEKLNKKGLLESKQNPDNRRQLNIRVTNKGLDLMKEVDKVFVKINAFLHEAITEKEAKELESLMSKLEQMCFEFAESKK